MLTAFFGVFASAVLIAVFISKISLSRSEQMVLDFVNRINQAREYKMKTMQIIQYSVRAWFLKQRKPHYRATFSLLYRLHTAIQQARAIKQQQLQTKFRFDRRSNQSIRSQTRYVTDGFCTKYSDKST